MQSSFKCLNIIEIFRMFQFFSILLLLIAVLQIVEAIKIWVKPSDLRYTAEIICLNSDGLITIGQATHASVFGEEWSTGYVDIDTDFSGCDQRNSTVKVLITNLDHPYESGQFKIPKAAFSARRSAIVLGFDILPSAHTQFNFQQSSSNFGVSQRPLMDYQLEISCQYRHADGSLQYYLIGSGIHLNEQNYINIPIYEIEMLAVCNHGRIELVIHHDERESTHIDVTRELLLENDAFNINMSNRTVQPISQRRTEIVLSRTIVPSSTIPSGASSSTTRQTESSPTATVHDETSTSFSSQVDEMKPKQQSNICVFCLNSQREIAFVPCGHICACRECSEKIKTSNKNECPICRKKIKEAFDIYLPPSLNIPSGTSSSITKQTEFNNNECVFCHKGQREIAFRPCGHICACRECSKSINKCPKCRQQIKEDFLIYFS